MTSSSSNKEAVRGCAGLICLILFLVIEFMLGRWGSLSGNAYTVSGFSLGIVLGAFAYVLAWRAINEFYVSERNIEEVNRQLEAARNTNQYALITELEETAKAYRQILWAQKFRFSQLIKDALIGACLALIAMLLGAYLRGNPDYESPLPIHFTWINITIIIVCTVLGGLIALHKKDTLKSFWEGIVLGFGAGCLIATILSGNTLKDIAAVLLGEMVDDKLKVPGAWEIIKSIFSRIFG